MKTTALLATALLVSTATTQAADYCVDDVNALQPILNLAGSNGEDDHIMLVQGFYDIPGGGLTYTSSDGGDLEISGGWQGICLARSGDAFDTVLDGGSTDRILSIVANGRSVTVDRLMFFNGSANLGAGLHVLFALNLVVERSAFVGNNGLRSALYASDGINSARISNNLFTLNEGGQVAELRQSGGEGLYFNNNTVVDNTAAKNASVELVARDGASALVANNILWHNTGHDLDLFRSTGDLFYWNNSVGSYRGPPVGVNNVSLDPLFEPGVFSYELSPSSPLIDAGTLPPDGSGSFESDWDVGVVDFAGDTRVQGGNVEMGAFEASDVLFETGFGDFSSTLWALTALDR